MTDALGTISWIVKVASAGGNLPEDAKVVGHRLDQGIDHFIRLITR